MELYNVLLKQCNNYNSEINENELKDMINALDKDGQEIVYALIKHNYVLYQNNATSFPYNGKILKDGRIKFDLCGFPDQLIKILWIFVNKHTNKMNDEMKRIKIDV